MHARKIGALRTCIRAVEDLTCPQAPYYLAPTVSLLRLTGAWQFLSPGFHCASSPVVARLLGVTKDGTGWLAI